MPTSDHTAAPADTTRKRKPRSFPSAYTILAGITVLVWFAAFILPSGAYDTNDAGRPVPGTYHTLSTDLSFSDRLMQLFLAPINGLYGVKNETSGLIGPYETGELYGAAGSSFSSSPSGSSSPYACAPGHSTMA